MSFILKAGDLEPPLEVQLTEKDGTGIDLTGQTVNIRMRQPDGTVSTVAAALGSGSNPASEGWIHYDWVSGDTNQVGEILLEFVNTVSGGRVRTFPSSTIDRVLVEPIIEETIPTDIKWGDVLALDSTLCDVPDELGSLITYHANNGLNAEVFGGEDAPLYRLARLYYAAHFATLTLRGANGAAGPVTQESVGGLMIQYANTGAAGSNVFALTSFGQAWLNLVRGCPLARLPRTI